MKKRLLVIGLLVGIGLFTAGCHIHHKHHLIDSGPPGHHVPPGHMKHH